MNSSARQIFLFLFSSSFLFFVLDVVQVFSVVYCLVSILAGSVVNQPTGLLSVST